MSAVPPMLNIEEERSADERYQAPRLAAGLSPLLAASLKSESKLSLHSLSSQDKTTLFGFWFYLMTDVVLFASLFAVFAVLYVGTAGGPTARDIVSMPLVMIETLLLLTSSFTCGLALLAAREGSPVKVLIALLATFILGASFVGIEVAEFAKLVAEGFGPLRSGFLSAYFTLVGTHGLHVSIGLLWMLVLMIVIFLRDLSRSTMRKLLLVSLFWHFLDIVWIFIFTVVYLLAV